MVNGFLKFKEHFKDFKDNFIIIGGVACDILISEAGLRFRATKDFDIVLIINNLSPEFVKHIWGFVKKGGYNKREKDRDKKKYYRFTKPKKKEFPFQIEIFSRKPDILGLAPKSILTPISVGEEISSLSAILMNEDYYGFTVENSIIKNDLRIASVETLILLKAKAVIDMTERRNKGEKIDGKQIKKHKNDVIRLSVLLDESKRVTVSEKIKKDFTLFLKLIEKERVDLGNIAKHMGLPKINEEKLIAVIKSVFGISECGK